MYRSDDLQKSTFWPTPQDYNEAVQALHANSVDPQLSGGQIMLDTMGLPRPVTGAFASVYKVMTGSSDFALRCFLRRVDDQETRYIAISNFVQSDDLPYTVTFDYQSRGIRINGTWFPALKMEWVEGLPLDAYLAQHYHDGEKLIALAENFRKMCCDLRLAGIAHGDLQHGNIIVIENDELRLVDYDGMYVPSMEGMQSSEIGHRNYQHPRRTGQHFDSTLDNFSAWVIYSSLKAISIDARLYRDLRAGDDCLLFKQSDFQEPLQSNSFAHLESHRDEKIRRFARFIRAQLAVDPTAVPPLETGEPEEVIHLDPLLPKTVILAKAAATASLPEWLRGLVSRPQSSQLVAPAVSNLPKPPSRYPTIAGYEPEWDAFVNGELGVKWSGTGADPRVRLIIASTITLVLWIITAVISKEFLPPPMLGFILLGLGYSAAWIIPVSHFLLLRRAKPSIGTITDRFQWEGKHRITYKFFTDKGIQMQGGIDVSYSDYEKISRGQKLTIVYEPLDAAVNMPYRFCTYQLGHSESLFDMFAIPIRRFRQNKQLQIHRWWDRQSWWVLAVFARRNRRTISKAAGLNQLNRIPNRECVWRDKSRCGVRIGMTVIVAIVWALIWNSTYLYFGAVGDFFSYILILSFLSVELAILVEPFRDRLLLKEGIAVPGRIVERVDPLQEATQASWHVEYDFSTLNGRRLRRRQKVTELQYRNLCKNQPVTVLYIEAPTQPSIIYDLSLFETKPLSIRSNENV